MKKTLLLLLVIFSMHARAQINEGGTYQFFTCKNRTETYVYYGGTSDPNRIYCPIRWTVTGGVFTSNNATVLDTYTDPSTGISSAAVKWTTDNATGIIAVTTPTCANGNSSRTITFRTNPTTLTATPSTVNLGQSTTLTASPTFTTTSIQWTSPAGGGLNSTSGTTVTATPTVTTLYTCNVNYQAILQINFQTVKTINCTQTKTISVAVSADNITGNTICCDQCIASGQSASALEQASGTSLGGASSYTYQWAQSSDGTNFTPVTGATSASFSPGVLTATRWYRRVVNSGANSNIIKVDVVPGSLTIGATTYSSSASIRAANSLTIQGSQTSTPSIDVTFAAGTSIVVLPETILNSNVRLYAGEICAPANGRMRASHDYSMTDKQVSSPDADLKPLIEHRQMEAPIYEEEGVYLTAYPNPAHGVTTFRYKVEEKGMAKLYLSDVSGKEMAILVDKPGADPGVYDAVFDSSELASGIYISTLITASRKVIKKLYILNSN